MNPNQFAMSKPIELIPSGVQSLDAIVGGGFQVGSLITLLCDESSEIFSDMFLKVFIAQGIVSSDQILLASHDASKRFFQLPRPSEVNQAEIPDSRLNEPMKIAFRYETMRDRTDFHIKHASTSSNFQFSHNMSNEMLESSSFVTWPTGQDTSYKSLLNFIEGKLKSEHLFIEDSRKYPNKNVLRVCLHNLGSLLWTEESSVLPSFLFKLRRLVHNARTVAFITLPAPLLQNSIQARCEQLSDTVVQLESIDVTANPLFSEYSGLINFLKMSPVNSIVSQIIERKDWAFKLVKKRLLVERLSLPPEVNTSAQQDQDGPSCSSFTKVLDF